MWGAPLLRAPQPSRGDVFTKGKNSKEILFGLVCFFLKTLEPLTITVLGNEILLTVVHMETAKVTVLSVAAAGPGWRGGVEGAKTRPA